MKTKLLDTLEKAITLKIKTSDDVALSAISTLTRYSHHIINMESMDLRSSFDLEFLKEEFKKYALVYSMKVNEEGSKYEND